jgi:VWFA-related protein
VAVVVGLLEAAGATRAATNGPSPREPTGPPPPVFGAAVELILVDAVVTDRQGRMVTGLTAEDFVVREDGQPQALTSFEAVELATVVETRSSPAATPRVTANDGAAQPIGRVFVLVLDDAGFGLEGAIAARKAAKQFLSGAARPGDLVSIVVPEGGLAWSARLPAGQASLESVLDSVKARAAVAPELAGNWEALQIVGGTDPFAQERARVRLDAAGQLKRAMRFPGETDAAYEERNRAYQTPSLRADAGRQVDRDSERRRRLFESVSSALEAVASVKGRKSVLLFSEGFIREPRDPLLAGLTATMRRSNASIYFVDVRRLASGTAADSREPGDRSASTRRVDVQESSGAEVVAEETGGFTVRGSGELEEGLARVARESSSYYLLGYSPTHPTRDGTFRRLQVEVRRPDVEVRARNGYYALTAEKAAAGRSGRPSAAADLEAALASAVPAREIPLRLSAFAQQPLDKKKVRVRLAAEVGLDRVRFEEEADGTRAATLDVALAMNHVEPAGRLRTPWREWTVRLPARTEGAGVWIPLEGSFDVPGGAGQARLVVRDRASGKVGSVVHDFEVPAPGTWRVSTPILSKVPGEGHGHPPRLLFERRFAAGTPLYCYLEVYDSAKKKAAAPRVSLAYTLVDAFGKTRRSQAASPLDLSAAGTPTRLERIPLAGLAPGVYELRLLVRDETAGRTQELREPFAVTRPTRPDLAIYLDIIQAFRAGEIQRAATGVMEWRPKDLEALAASLPTDDADLRRAALRLHTELALRLWGNGRVFEAEAQVAIGRAVLAKDPPPELHRDWLLELGDHQLASASPATALPFFEECTRLFPDAAEAWLGVGMAHEFTAFPGGFGFAAKPTQDAAAKAERGYREAVRLDPRLAEARLRRGRVLGLAGDFGEAEKELAAAVETSGGGPLAALARVFWGGLRDRQGDLPGALGHYEAALDADPQSQTAAFALSEALHRSGRHREAAERLAATLAASPPTELSPWHAYHLGRERRRALSPAPETAAPSAAGQER